MEVKSFKILYMCIVISKKSIRKLLEIPVERLYKDH